MVAPREPRFRHLFSAIHYPGNASAKACPSEETTASGNRGGWRGRSVAPGITAYCDFGHFPARGCTEGEG